MDEVAFQPINGLTITKGGESFTFSTAGTYFYNNGGPGQVTFVQDPSICCGSVFGGNPQFSVAFSVAVTSIQFGIAENVVIPLTGAHVTLSNGDNLSFNLPLNDPYAEGQFTWSGSPVTGFELFAAPGASGLAFDNLAVSFAVPGPIVGAGLPGLIFASGGLLGWWRRKRKAMAAGSSQS
jgi:hypothetical protein